MIGLPEEELRRRHPSSASKTSSNGSSASNGTGVTRKLSFAQMRKEEAAKGPCEKIVHRPQDSLFSSSSGWTNYRGFFNLAMLLLIVSNGRVALENLIKYGILISPIQWMSFMLEEASIWNWPNLAMVLLSNTTVIVVFLMEKVLEKGYLSNYFAAVFYSIIISAHLAIPAAFTLVLKGNVVESKAFNNYRRVDTLVPMKIPPNNRITEYCKQEESTVARFLMGNPLCSVCALSVFVVESLKLVSYIHVNYWCRCARLDKAIETKKKDYEARHEMSAPEMASLYPASLNLCNLYYFMFAPTLCYELRFPRSVRRRKIFLIKRFIELVFLSFLIAALVQQWIVPIVHNSMRPLNEMEFGRSLERLLKLAIPNIVIWLIGFYTLFHAMLNFVAEILKFADREFYRDFWNSETIQYFWRTWNIPVHRWAARHIYFPMMRNKYNKFSAMIVVFFVSAFFHEYLVSIPLHMFRLWAYYGMMAQIPLSLITDYVVKGGRAGNVIVWLSLIVGQPLAILMYFHDWYVLHRVAEVPSDGVCNGINEVYELAVSEKQRAEFVNVSETILSSIWSESMSKKLFTISSVLCNSHCTISFTTKRTFVLNVNHDLSRLAFIMEEMLKCIENFIVEKNQQKLLKAKKTVPEVPVKRRKVPKKGIKWDED